MKSDVNERPECTEPVNEAAPEIDEYLWPLVGETSASVDWSLLAEELQIRQRLVEIMAHVHTTHVMPRLRRAEVRSTAQHRGIVESVIAGSPDAPPWEQMLRAPVPRALRDEFRELAQRLRAIGRRRRQLA